jgi:hypothetical protein
MEVKLTNRVTMLKATSSYMAENSTVWNSMARLQTAMTDFNGKIAEIDTAAQEHGTPNGATADKATARDALEDVTYLMCEALSVLAHEGANNELAALTRVARTTLDRMDEEELSNRAATVLAQANTHKSELATLQVTQANIDEMSSALTEFNTAKTAPRTATATRAALTERLPQLIKEATDILRNRVDAMVNLFSRTNPDFVAGYENARAIVDRAATHKTKAAQATTPPAPAA